MGCAPSNERPPSRDSPQASRLGNKRHSTNNTTTPTTTPRNDPSDDNAVRSKKPLKKRREALTKPRSGSHSPQTTHSSLRSPEQKYQHHQVPSSFYYNDDEDDDDDDEGGSHSLNTNRSVVSLGGSRRAVPRDLLEQGHFGPLRDSGDSGDSLANQANPFSLEEPLAPSEGSPMMPSTQQFSADVDQPLFSRTPSAHHDALNQQAPPGSSFVISKHPPPMRNNAGGPHHPPIGVDSTGNFGFRQELEQRQKTRAEKDEEELERRSVDRIRAKQRRRFGRNGGYLTPKLGSLEHYRVLMRNAAQDSGSDADDPYFNTVDGAEVVAEGRYVEVLDRDRNVLLGGNADLNSSQSSASGTPRSILRKQSSFGELGGPGGGPGGGNLVNAMRHRQGGRRSRGNSMQQRLVRAPSMCSSTVSSADSAEGYTMGDPFMGSMTSSRNIPSMQLQQPQSSSEQSSASPVGLRNPNNNNPSPLTLGAPDGSNHLRQHSGFHSSPTGAAATASPASPGTTTPTTRNPSSALLQLPVGPGGNTTSGNGTPNSSFGALSPSGISAHINTPNDQDQSEGSLRMRSDLCDLPAFIADDLHVGGRTSSQMTLPVNQQQQQQANPSLTSQAALSPTDTTSQQARSPQQFAGSRVTFRSN